jgi:hypothetical protein
VIYKFKRGKDKENIFLVNLTIQTKNIFQVIYKTEDGEYFRFDVTLNNYGDVKFD